MAVLLGIPPTPSPSHSRRRRISRKQRDESIHHKQTHDRKQTKKKEKEKYIHIYVLKRFSLLRLFHVSSIRVRSKAKIHWRSASVRLSVRTTTAITATNWTDRQTGEQVEGWMGGRRGPPSFALLPSFLLLLLLLLLVLRSVFGLVLRFSFARAELEAVEVAFGFSSFGITFWFFFVPSFFFSSLIWSTPPFSPPPSLLSSAPRQLQFLLLLLLFTRPLPPWPLLI